MSRCFNCWMSWLLKPARDGTKRACEQRRVGAHDLYGFLDNTERAGFKSQLIQQLKQRDIQVPWWLKHLG
jgi:hypothetical protein